MSDELMHCDIQNVIERLYLNSLRYNETSLSVVFRYDLRREELQRNSRKLQHSIIISVHCIVYNFVYMCIHISLVNNPSDFKLLMTQAIVHLSH